MPLEILPLALLDDTAARSVRAVQSAEAIAEYAAARKAGADFAARDPLHVLRDEAGGLHLWDGSHRKAAFLLAGDEVAACDVEPGTFGEALARARRANVLHGLRRSQADKQAIGRSIVEEELARRAAGQKETPSRDLGALAGGTRDKPELSHTFINKLITQITAERAEKARRAAEEEGWIATILALAGPVRALGFEMVKTSYGMLDLRLEGDALLATLPNRWERQSAAEKLALLGARDPRQHARPHDVLKLTTDARSYTAIVTEGNSWRWTVHHLGSDQHSYIMSEWAAYLETVTVEVIQQAIPRPPARPGEDPVWTPPPDGRDWIALHPYAPSEAPCSPPAPNTTSSDTPADPTILSSASTSATQAPADRMPSRTPAPASVTTSAATRTPTTTTIPSSTDQLRIRHLGARPISECLTDLAALLPARDLRSSLSHGGGVTLESTDGAHEFVVIVEHRDGDEGGSRATEMERYLGELLVLLSQGEPTTEPDRVMIWSGEPDPVIDQAELAATEETAAAVGLHEEIRCGTFKPPVDRAALIDRLQERRAGRPMKSIADWLRKDIERVHTMDEMEAVNLVGWLNEQDAQEAHQRAELRERITHLVTYGHARTLTPDLADTTPRLSLGALASRVQDAWELAYPEPEDHPYHQEPSCPDISPPVASPASPSAERVSEAPLATADDCADSATVGAGPTCSDPSPYTASAFVGGGVSTSPWTSTIPRGAAPSTTIPASPSATPVVTSPAPVLVSAMTATASNGTTSPASTATTEPTQLNPADFWACGTCGRITEQGDSGPHVALHGIMCPQVEPFAALDLHNPMEVQRWRIFQREYGAQHVMCSACNGVTRLRPGGSIPPHTRPRREGEKGRRKLVPCEGSGTVPGAGNQPAATPAQPKPPSKGATKATSLLFGLRDLGVELFTYTDEDGESDEQTISTWLSDVSTMAAPRLKHLTAALEVALASAKMSAEDRQRAASAAQEPARPPASERRAEGRERGARIGRCIARVRALQQEGVILWPPGGTHQQTPSIMLLRLQEPELSEHGLATYEAILFPPEPEAGPQHGPVQATRRERAAFPDPPGNMVVDTDEDEPPAAPTEAAGEQQALPVSPPASSVEELRRRLEGLLGRDVTSLPFEGRPALPIRAILFNLETFTEDQRAALAEQATLAEQRQDCASEAVLPASGPDPMAVYRPWRGTADELAAHLEAMEADPFRALLAAFGVSDGKRIIERLANEIMRTHPALEGC